MSDLVIVEANSIFKRPLLFKNGEMKENNLVVESNIDKMYLKLESKSKESVSC